MEALRQWGLGLCCGAAAAGIVQLLSPPTATGRLLRIVVGVFLLCCLAAPLGSFALPEVQHESGLQQQAGSAAAEEFGAAADRVFYASAAQKLEQLARKKLAEMGINEAEVTVYINETTTRLEPEDIVVEARLGAGHRERHEELVRRLEYELGTTVRLGYEKQMEG